MATSTIPSLHDHLTTLLPSHPSLATSVIPTLLTSINTIAQALRSAHTISLAGTANQFGDDQLNVDLQAELIIRAAIATCPSIKTASSEEDPVEVSIKHTTPASSPGSTEQYTLAFDPLDGSSIIAPNFTVGTILSLWTGSTALHAPPSTSLTASILALYGPRTTAIIALRTPTTSTCFEVAIPPSPSAPYITRPSIKFDPPASIKTRYFAPANLRAAADDPNYMKLISHFIEQRYTLRYSGGLVPDIAHALSKGNGVYVSPVNDKSKAKLRRLYELTPVALVVECCGGVAIDPADGREVLGRVVLDCDERGGIVCGTGDDVEMVMKALRD